MIDLVTPEVTGCKMHLILEIPACWKKKKCIAVLMKRLSIFNHYVCSPDLPFYCSRHGSTVSRRRCAACCLQLLIWQLTAAAAPSCSITPCKNFTLTCSSRLLKMTLIMPCVFFMININTSFAPVMLSKWSCICMTCSLYIISNLIHNIFPGTVMHTQLVPVYKHCNTFISSSWAKSPLCYLIRWYSR